MVCELIGFKGEVAAGILDARDVYERALEAYFAGDFERAATLFLQASELHPGDLAAQTMRERCEILAEDPPLNWSGIHIMHEK